VPVLDLGGEGGIARALERAQPVRLEAVSVPDPLHGAQRDPDRAGHGPAGPVRDLARRLRAGQRQHLGDRLGRMGWCPGRTRLVAQQTLDARLGVAPLPAPHGRTADARSPGDVLDTQALGREQDDAGALDMFERARAVAGDRSQPCRVARIEKNAYRLSHGPDSHASPPA